MTADREFMGFVKKTATVLSAFLIAVSVLTILSPWMPWTIKARQDQLEAAVVRIAEVVELGATINAESPQSPEFKQARQELRRLRRVKFTLKDGHK